ncbi:MAG: class I SAM-dependent methyltransferase [Halioglobus sp.]|nr:class I SAM-dependent methyltransferase [Halioglobus sp.]
MRKNIWDKAAKEYNQAVGNAGDVYHKAYTNPRIFQLLGDIKNKRILDLACGQGYFSELMEKHEGKVTGVDYSQEFIKLAKARNLKAKFFVDSSSNMKDLKNHYFDIIVCNFGLHDIRDIKGTIKECNRVLKKNGKFVWSIPHPVFHTAGEGEKNGIFYKEIFDYKRLKTHTPQWEFDNEIKQYRRPIDYYLGEMFANGFVISNFFEVSTRHKGGKLVKDKVLLKFNTEIPQFLIVEGIKI